MAYITEKLGLLGGVFLALSFFNYIERRRFVGWCLFFLIGSIGFAVYKSGTFDVSVIPVLLMSFAGYIAIGSGWAVWCYRQICERLVAKMADDLQFTSIKQERKNDIVTSYKRQMSVGFNTQSLSYSMIFWPVDFCSSVFGGVFRLAENIITGIRVVTYDKIRAHYESRIDAIANEAFTVHKDPQ